MLKKININDLKQSATKLIGKDWMLVTAGNTESCNTMTASWGGLGELWNRPVAFIFVRPTRYTYEFIERENFFTLSFFEEKHRKTLQLCGTISGRKSDKIAESGLTPVASDNGSVFFQEAKLVLECKKLYFADLNPENFLDQNLEKHYPHKDYHRVYVAEIVNTYAK
jgi:flavin reductase (DIM6/NTAB) family NADH-FMN oxidoreductase RutF